jgi:uncharacterized protein
LKLYLDSSAIVKLVKRESESEALRDFVRQHRHDLRVTSSLARVEVVRALLPAGPEAIAHARRQLDRVHQISMDRNLLDDAATLQPHELLRSLDAIHLASAGLIGAELRAMVTYDQRMAEAATALGMVVEAPA